MESEEAFYFCHLRGLIPRYFQLLLKFKSSSTLFLYTLFTYELVFSIFLLLLLSFNSRGMRAELIFAS